MAVVCGMLEKTSDTACCKHSIVGGDGQGFAFGIMGNDAAAAERALRDQTEANPAWAALTAVNEGRYVLLDPALFLYKPLDAWDEAYRVIAAALYGDQLLEGLPAAQPEIPRA